MIEITHFGYDCYELKYDYSSGDMIKTEVPQGFKGKRYGDIDDCLRDVSMFLMNDFRREDWCFEENLDTEGNDGWVLHLIVRKDNMGFATTEMIESWRKDGNPDLMDLLVNVFVKNVDNT